MTSEARCSGIIKVVIGSLNVAKMSAVEQGFAKVFDSIVVEGIAINDKPQQPITDSATLYGTEHRAGSARPDADCWVGIEGGVEPVSDKLMVMAWVVIMPNNGVAHSRSAAYQLPKPAVAAVRADQPLVSAKAVSMDSQRLGLVASLSQGLIRRSSICRTRNSRASAVLGLMD
jgi:inosine/xanthosine triphosphatase